MTALIPTSSQANGVETYEDMFKEITRKLYGEETSHGLHTLGTPVAHIASGTNTNIPDGERSFTTLLSERNANSIDYEQSAGNDGNNILKNDDHLTAFGLALMQNGFQSHNSMLNSHTFNQINKQQHQQQQQQQHQHNSLNGLNQSNGNMNTMAVHNAAVAATDNMHEKWANSQHQSTEMNGWNSKSQNYPNIQKDFKAKKSEIHDIPPMSNQTSNIIANHDTMKQIGASKVNNNPAVQFQKRYSCTSCQYSTDRRDLFTRHENIHKEDKPFHCYVCLKVFNRADHVKKHFLRMHRSLTYDIGRTRRSTAGSRHQSQSKKMPTPTTASYFNQMAQTNDSITTLNIPSAYQNLQQIDGAQTMLDPNYNNGQRNNSSQPMQQSIQTTGIPSTSQQQQQQQQQQHNAVKMEKCSGDKTADKKKNDKRFMCCYCSWSGNDNWGLKRHLNTHTKPFVCVLCDYKAARSERLATHVFKVHNKKVCTKCNYLADNQTEYDDHVFEVHAHEARSQRNHTTNNFTDSKINSNILRSVNNTYANNSNMSTGHSVSSNQGDWRSSGGGGGRNDGSTSMTSSQSASKTIDSSKQKRGAERLFQYFEADDSDPEDYTRQLQMAALSRNTASVAQDFHNAGGEDKTDSIENSTTKIISNKNNASEFRCSKNALECGIAIDSNVETNAIQWKRSPPALHPNHEHRQPSSNELSEKENYMLTSDNSSSTNDGQPDGNNSKNGFDNYLRVTIPAASLSQKRIAGDAKYRATNSMSNGKCNMKRMVKRRLTAMQRIEQLRDKYLLRMISRKLSCRCCDEKKPFMIIPYHNYLSLMLHKLWRHPNKRYHCRMCSITFKYKYQLVLHNRQHCCGRLRGF